MTVAEDIRASIGVDVNLCYQCRRCTSSCPVASYYDLLPHEMIRHLQQDRVQPVLQSRMIWQCAECEACAERCPQGIEIARVMDYLRIRHRQEKQPLVVPAVPLFYRAALFGINLFGRMYEAGLMLQLYLSLFLKRRLNFKQLFQLDLPVGLKMLFKGKLPPFPSFAGRAKRIKPLPAEAIAYYPGCSLHATSREYDISAKAVFHALGRPLVEPPNWSCCGTTPAHSSDEKLATLLPYRNIATLQQMGADYVTMPCPSCFQRFRAAQNNAAQIPELAAAARERYHADPARPIEIEHTLMTLARRVDAKAVRQKVKKPLKGLRVVCYYGCAITRPSVLTGEKNVEDPQEMETLLQNIGCETLTWSHKTECCGVSHAITQLPLALDLSEKVLRDAAAVGAQVIAVACPLCQVNLDTRQANIAREYGISYNIPVLYFTQLIGLAFGLEAKQLGLGSHFVDTQPLLAHLNR